MHCRDPTGIIFKTKTFFSFTVLKLFMYVFWISIHICVTLQHVPVVDDFLQDLREAVETVSPLMRSLFDLIACFFFFS